MGEWGGPRGCNGVAVYYSELCTHGATRPAHSTCVLPEHVHSSSGLMRLIRIQAHCDTMTLAALEATIHKRGLDIFTY